MAHDFDKRFPKSADNLLNNWKEVAPHIVNLAVARQKIKEPSPDGIYFMFCEGLVKFVSIFFFNFC